MILKEENRDLFSVPHGYYLAHCISGDFALGAGIAVQFDNLYNMRQKLKTRYASTEENCIILIDNVFNIITKKRCFQKPTYDSLREALNDMREYIIDLEIEKIAMPQIGCGLDRLDWDIVKEIIYDVFEDVDVEILVCYI
jgi:hypothetical protein